MANLRIIYDNAIDRSTIVASSTAGSLIASNIKNDKKSKIWRSTSTSATLTVTWSSSEIISGVALPFCNLTATATLRIRGYTEAGDSVPVVDTGAINPVLVQPLGSWDWGAVPLGVNAYSYSGGTYGIKWLDNYYSIKKLVLDIVDTANTSGYIECSKIVAGSAWSPIYNTGFGMNSTNVDTSVRNRSEAGDLITTRNPRYKSLSFDLSWMQTIDRQRFNEIMGGNGLSRSMFISLFPEDLDVEKEQTYQIYGKLSSISGISHQMHTIYSGRVDIEEI